MRVHLFTNCHAIYSHFFLAARMTTSAPTATTAAIATIFAPVSQVVPDFSSVSSSESVPIFILFSTGSASTGREAFPTVLFCSGLSDSTLKIESFGCFVVVVEAALTPLSAPSELCSLIGAAVFLFSSSSFAFFSFLIAAAASILSFLVFSLILSAASSSTEGVFPGRANLFASRSISLSSTTSDFAASGGGLVSSPDGGLIAFTILRCILSSD
mmetsp:Transcript_24720/g.72365  ORF Transcript_24720/g.72365 Transcript_24720/m.72365 type:complete len:214 (-) Transcript_24720:408-1049(-)